MRTEARKQYEREWNERNKEHTKQWRMAYYKRNHNAILAKCRDYLQRPEVKVHRREQQLQYHAANRAARNENTRRWRKEHPERAAALARDWRERNPDKHRAVQKRQYDSWRKRNPEKNRAHQKVADALRRGRRMVKPDKCSLCGKKTRLEAHHSDYSKPLDVQWLCHGCHRKIEGRVAGAHTS